jgi:glucose-6-phosphate 1-epimerase
MGAIDARSMMQNAGGVSTSSPKARVVNATTVSHRRRRVRARMAMDDGPKYVRDSRDDARAKQARDAGKTLETVDAFVASFDDGEEGSSDSPVTRALNEEFRTRDGAVRVRDGRGGATKATLTHPSGAYADVYLRGGNVCSWVLASGGEVFYVPERADFKKHAPTDAGNPACFPTQADGGFASRMEWRIVETGTYAASDGTMCPFVAIELTDDDSSRAVFNHNFKLTQEISLEHNALRVKTTCANTGSSAFEYALGHKAHVAVNDCKEGDVYYVGFEDGMYLDRAVHPTKTRVRFTRDASADALAERCFKLDGRTDRVYLTTNDLDTGVEVGTGCTVYAQNLSGENGAVDRAVFNPGVDAAPNSYRWFAGLGIGNFGKLRVAEPDSKSTVEIQYKVVDHAPSVGIREEFEMFEKINARNAALNRQNVDFEATDLPVDSQ